MRRLRRRNQWRRGGFINISLLAIQGVGLGSHERVDKFRPPSVRPEKERERERERSFIDNQEVTEGR
jgi:hypothetical protein